MDPKAIYMPKVGVAKIICGDRRIFDPLLINVKKDQYGQVKLENDQTRFLTPQHATLILSNGGKHQEMEDNDCLGQLLWDLGIILFELATGNLNPHTHPNTQIVLRLIQKYPMAFPKNLPTPISDEL